MAVSPISSPHIVPQVRTSPPPTQSEPAGPTASTGNKGTATGATWNWAQDSGPLRMSATTLGIGLVVDKLV